MTAAPRCWRSTSKRSAIMLPHSSKRLELRGISVTGVTKATLGSPEIAGVLLQAGVRADRRLSHLRTSKRCVRALAGILAPMTLIRSPMMSQVERGRGACRCQFQYGPGMSSGSSPMPRTGWGGHMGSCSWLSLEISERGSCRMISSAPCVKRFAAGNIVLKGIGTNLACTERRVPRCCKHGKAICPRRVH